MRASHSFPVFSVILLQLAGTVIFVQLVMLLVTAFIAGTTSVKTTPEDNSFEEDILTFEATDRNSPPPEGAILFVGDSTFTRWAIEEDLPGYKVINRGFGGSKMSDLLEFTDQIVLPYKPRLIVVQEGGNDLHAGRTPEQLLADIKAFVEKVHQALPNVAIAIGSLNANPARWSEADVRKSANQIIKDYVSSQRNVSFVNFFEPFLGDDGKPQEELFVEDGGHPSALGYKLRAKIMRPILGEPDDQLARSSN